MRDGGGGGGVCGAPEAELSAWPSGIGEDVEGGGLDSPPSSVPTDAYVFLLGLDVSPSSFTP